MKPFDLQKALAGDPVVTRDGRPVKIAGYNEDAHEDVVLCGWVAGNAHQWYKDGSCEYEEYLDLFMAPTERKEWVVRYYSLTQSKHFISGPFSDKRLAELFMGIFDSPTIHEITIHD
jgi:hypothetical protein